MWTMCVQPNDANLLGICLLPALTYLQTNEYRHVLNINKCTTCNHVLGLAVDKTVLREAIILHCLINWIISTNYI